MAAIRFHLVLANILRGSSFDIYVWQNNQFPPSEKKHMLCLFFHVISYISWHDLHIYQIWTVNIGSDQTNLFLFARWRTLMGKMANINWFFRDLIWSQNLVNIYLCYKVFEEVYLPTPAYFAEYKLLHIFSAMQGFTSIEMSRFLYRVYRRWW